MTGPTLALRPIPTFPALQCAFLTPSLRSVSPLSPESLSLFLVLFLTSKDEVPASGVSL